MIEISKYSVFSVIGKNEALNLERELYQSSRGNGEGTISTQEEHDAPDACRLGNCSTAREGRVGLFTQLCHW